MSDKKQVRLLKLIWCKYRLIFWAFGPSSGRIGVDCYSLVFLFLCLWGRWNSGSASWRARGGIPCGKIILNWCCGRVALRSMPSKSSSSEPQESSFTCPSSRASCGSVFTASLTVSSDRFETDDLDRSMASVGPFWLFLLVSVCRPVCWLFQTFRFAPPAWKP